MRSAGARPVTDPGDRLARRPSQLSSAHDMKMQVRNFLASVVAAIANQAVAADQTFGSGDLRGHDDAAADDGLIVLG